MESPESLAGKTESCPDCNFSIGVPSTDRPTPIIRWKRIRYTTGAFVSSILVAVGVLTIMLGGCAIVTNMDPGLSVQFGQAAIFTALGFLELGLGLAIDVLGDIVRELRKR
jgi:hypothetical protein